MSLSTPDPRDAITAPVPTATLLDVISGIAATLGSAASLDRAVPTVLANLANALDAAECAVWVGAEDHLRPGWSHGEHSLTVGQAQAALRGCTLDCVLVAPLISGPLRIGALGVRSRSPLRAERAAFVRAVADVLGPALGYAEAADRLRAEVAARTAEIDHQRRLLAKIVDSLPLGLYVIDRAYRIQAWNRKRETGALGVAREDAMGRSIFDVLHRQSADVLRHEFEEVFATGEIAQFMVETDSGDGPRTYRLSKIPMRLDDADVTHAITIAEDLTDWQEAQDRVAQAEKLAALGTLAAGVMHEINNPIATIAAAAEASSLRLAGDAERLGQLATDLGEVMSLIQAECHRCRRISDSVLEFGRPKPASRGPVELNAVIERVLFLLTHHPRFKKVAVELELDRGTGLVVMADEEQLVQVLMALLLNAADAMDEQGTIRVRTVGEGTSVIAEVIDAGIGIRRADLPRIFEPFFTTKRPGRGTGLGLAVCYSIVAAHGGRIEVESVPDEGSVFRMILPRTTVT